MRTIGRASRRRAPVAGLRTSAIADTALGSSDPTYQAINKRVALTAAERRLVVHGKHGDGVQLAWSDDGGTWSRTTRGNVTDGRILSGQSTGDIHAAIAVGTDTGGNEVAVVVCSGPGSTSTRALQVRRLSDLDNPLGPNVGPLVELDAGGTSAGNSKADIGKERTAGGVERLCVTWLKQTAATPTYDLRYGWITDLTTDTLAFGTTGNLLAALTSGARHGNLVEKPAESHDGLGFISKTGTVSTNTKLFQRSSASALTAWSEAAASGGASASAGYPSAVRLGSEWAVATMTDTATGVVVAERWSDDGSTRTLDVTTTAGYFDPVMLTDGAKAYLVMRKGASDADTTVVSRTYTPGSGWTTEDLVELSGQGGGHVGPNGLRDGSLLGGIMLIVAATGVGSTQKAVIAVERPT